MNARAYQHLITPLLAHQAKIEHAFDIPSIKDLPTLVKLLNIQMVEQEEEQEIGLLTFTLTYKEISPLEFRGWKLMDLPEDVEREIYSYFKNSLEITLQIDFRNRWPFRSPRTKILSCSKQAQTKEFTELVHRYNCDLQADWSPALGFDKTLLMLLVRLLEKIQYV